MRNRCTLFAAIIVLLIAIPTFQDYPDISDSIYKRAQFADDGAPPVISLLSPSNGSVVKPFSLIDLDVTDNVAVSHVLYHWEMIANETLDSPYDLLARTSEVGHSLYVYANDTSGTWTRAMFYFVSDGTDPEVSLTTPTNNSVQLSGIDVNATVTDIHLTDVFYQWDDQEIINIWIEPYSTQLISNDGPHTLHVYANDSAGNWVETNFVFIVDDDAPIIILRDLSNGTARQSNSIVDVDIVDASTMTVLYNWNSASQNTTWSDPYLTTVPAGESLHTLTVYANDSFSRWNIVTFEFIGDNTLPEIHLYSPSNGSLHNSGTEVTITATDTHLSSVSYNWDGLGNQTLSGTITIPSGDGDHVLRIFSNDTAENMASVKYLFRVDDSPPVIETVPQSSVLSGFNNFTIEWIAFDANPSMYIVLVNGSEVSSGSWSDRISVAIAHVAGFSVWYNCTILLFDSAGNSVVNSTMIRIEVSSIEDLNPLLLAFVVGGCASAAIVILLYVQKKKGLSFSKR